MDHELKLKALSKIAHTEGANVVETLNKEASKVESTLQSDDNYFTLEKSIKTLGTFAFRVPEKSISIAFNFLNRLENIKINFKEDEYSQAVEEFYNKEKLIIQTMELLERIRYFDIHSILSVFLKYSNSSDGSVSQKAIEGMESIAEYNIDLFYGTQEQKGYGPYAQIEVVKKIESLTIEEKNLYFGCILAICDKLLSATATGISYTYKEFTWKSAPISADKNIAEIRENTIKILIDLYELSETTSKKIQIINTMYSVVHTPHLHGYSDELMNIIYSNLKDVLKFYKQILDKAPLNIIQKIEHNTFWIFKNRNNEVINDIALDIRDTINLNSEYQIYKILVGFEGVFEEWVPKEKETGNEIQEESDYREQKATELSQAITTNNFEEWKNRILEFSKIKSDDLAMFPYFGKFLEKFANNTPKLAIKLLENHANELERFLTAILCGLWIKNKNIVIPVLTNWIKKGVFLFSCARLFEYTEDVDENLLEMVLSKGMEKDDEDTLIQIISVAFSIKEKNRTKNTIKFFITALNHLTSLGNSNWINAVWFRRDINNLLSSLDEKEIECIFDNLVLSNEIEYHAEEILTHIANNYPEKTINFFGLRLNYKSDNDTSSRYDAIPFDLHELKKPLSKIPEQAVNIISKWYDGKNYGMFIYEGANLLKIIFPDFPQPFEKKLTELVNSGDIDKIDIVLAVLRNYEGNIFLHNICKELLKKIPDNKKYLSEIIAILETTGVVSGEYGFVKVYERKKEEVSSWLEDDDAKIRDFAAKYQQSLQLMIERETKRADEGIELRKHEYGE